MERELYIIELYIRESGIHVFLSVLGPIIDDPIECCKWVERNFPSWLTCTTEREEKAWEEHEARMAAIEERYQWGLNVAYAEGGYNGAV